MPGRKRKLEQASEENLALCLQAAPRVANASVTRIWSIARGESVDSAHVQLRRLEDAKKCFHSHSLKATQGPDVKVWVADLPQLLRRTVTRCPSWAEALEAALNATSDETLTAVLYRDELVCGNIVAPRQSKKICLLYLSFREMRIHLHKEAWLTIACLQRMAIKDVEGGMSCIMATVCKEVRKQTHLDGFPLPLASGPRKLALRARSLLLSDHGAQRATWGVKGSAGIKPCVHCCNILNNGAEIFEPFRPLSESDCSKFIPFKDEEYFQRADDLGRIRRVGERAHLRKHRQVKGSGCMDRQKKATNQSESTQRSLLPRLLDSTLRLANEYGLGAWEPMRGPRSQQRRNCVALWKTAACSPAKKDSACCSQRSMLEM